MVKGITLVPRLNDGEGWTKLLRFADPRARFDPKRLRLVAGRNGAGRIREHLCHDDRSSTQSGIVLLFARRKKRVEVEKQPTDSGPINCHVHGLFLARPQIRLKEKGRFASLRLPDTSTLFIAYWPCATFPVASRCCCPASRAVYGSEPCER